MSDRNKRPLGSAQLYVLSMTNPEWITKQPDSRSVKVLRTLETRGLTYQSYGRWYISLAGKEALRGANHG